MMQLEYTIRQEVEADYASIYSLIETAFKTAKVSDGDEQDYAIKLRNSKKYIPQLALVAEIEGILIGHIMFTRFEVLESNGKKIESLLVAPLSVAIEYRNMGVGSALMNEGLRLAKSLGYKSAFLCGYPDYYKRFGFIESDKFGITNVNNVPSQYCLVCELDDHALNDIAGVIDFFG